MTTEQILALTNPLREDEVRQLVPQEWSDETLRGILGTARPSVEQRPVRVRRARLLVLVVLVIATLAVPTYAIGKAVRGWLDGEPAPESVVNNFSSYPPQLGFRPKAGKAVRVASDGAFVLFATPNDRGSYCLATSTPDGGICIRPSVAAATLIAGIMPGDPGRADARRTVLVAGRVKDSHAVAIAFTNPDGAEVTRPLGLGGFFLVALQTAEPEPGAPVYLCKNGGWAPVFHAFDRTGAELLTAKISLASQPSGLVGSCGWENGPHK